jgi:hypothetical protein
MKLTQVFFSMSLSLNFSLARNEILLIKAALFVISILGILMIVVAKMASEDQLRGDANLEATFWQCCIKLSFLIMPLIGVTWIYRAYTSINSSTDGSIYCNSALFFLGSAIISPSSLVSGVILMVKIVQFIIN